MEEGTVTTFSEAHIKMNNLGKEYSWALVQLVMNIKNPVNMLFFARKADTSFVIQISSAYANNVQIPPQESICKQRAVHGWTNTYFIIRKGLGIAMYTASQANK